VLLQGDWESNPQVQVIIKCNFPWDRYIHGIFTNMTGLNVHLITLKSLVIHGLFNLHLLKMLGFPSEPKKILPNGGEKW